MSRIFWIIAGLLFGAAFIYLLASNGTADGLLNFRTWLLLAAGVIAAVLGNVNRTIG